LNAPAMKAAQNTDIQTLVVVCHGAILNAAGEYGHRASGNGKRMRVN